MIQVPWDEFEFAWAGAYEITTREQGRFGAELAGDRRIVGGFRWDKGVCQLRSE